MNEWMGNRRRARLRPAPFRGCRCGGIPGFAAGFTRGALTARSLDPDVAARALADGLGAPDAEVVTLDAGPRPPHSYLRRTAARTRGHTLLGEGDGLVDLPAERPPRSSPPPTAFPIVLADPVTGWIAAVHAGWRGTAARVLDAALDALEARGVRPGNLSAAFGPSISRDRYEVGPEVVAALRRGVRRRAWGRARPGRGDGKSFVDVAAFNEAALLARGLDPATHPRPGLCNAATLRPAVLAAGRPAARAGSSPASSASPECRGDLYARAARAGAALAPLELAAGRVRLQALRPAHGHGDAARRRPRSRTRHRGVGRPLQAGQPLRRLVQRDEVHLDGQRLSRARRASRRPSSRSFTPSMRTHSNVIFRPRSSGHRLSAAKSSARGYVRLIGMSLDARLVVRARERHREVRPARPRREASRSRARCPPSRRSYAAARPPLRGGRARASRADVQERLAHPHEDDVRLVRAEALRASRSRGTGRRSRRP